MKATCSHKQCEDPSAVAVGPWVLCTGHAALAATLTAQASAVSTAEQATGTPGKNGASVAPCPSYAAQQRHKRRKEICEICNNIISVRHRVAACGTMAGYRKHLKEKEAVCAFCDTAMKETSARHQEARRLKTGAVPRQASAQAPENAVPIKPHFDDPRAYVRPRGTHCEHCPHPCKDYHLWDCKECVAEKVAVA